MSKNYRAYDVVTEWLGPPRETPEQAAKDATRHNRGAAVQGGYGSAEVVRRGEADRLYDLSGKPVWPPHGRSTGAARWRNPSQVLDWTRFSNPMSNPGGTFSGGDIARMHDDLRNRGVATINGLRFEIREAAEIGPYARKGARGVGGRRYVNWELLVDGHRVWSGEATDIDPLNIAGGVLEAHVVKALRNAGFRHERDI